LNSDPIISQISYSITEIFLFISPKFQENNSLTPLIIFALMTGIEIIFIIFQTFYYQVKRQHISWTLYLTHFVIEIFSAIIIAPLSNNIGLIASSIFANGVEIGSILTLCFL
jgi:hypothetical protein